MLEYYWNAPICQVMTNKGGRLCDVDSDEWIEELKSHTFDEQMHSFDFDTKDKGILDFIKTTASTIKVYIESDVVPAFQEVDIDKSGNIELAELGVLLKNLGSSADEETLERYMKELDINEDGVIDFKEFCDWYLRGFKVSDS